ncbi:MAG: hypothetical protein A3B74_03945 [Candidatus Kerfeldbacteria bacterium RIFCSPHIGHO2_02_FULL_42_14]|uniref:Uncharacterized protein n=1 Tax=Candidatus Kerfeldbacteria bacterium RIFCSPHIGHO2_02_FULL_42_14 TaxID=1798540 RepID=A0A1G2ASL4_9BACT|nr:MAG: hypothetical protein A3B74_03945 [Candidatus Kerfeldbacteria bacterium RIFCSPHIGHO2_02_FULL_42_14]OGY80662.1 MAG: hypothetical protein A3E60_04440 [Candidatus Kerfeldbacteria bacterium RIFCSPHIGHO2_12_FULL_42_13]OGY82589.1 MAG: hypothetical protein A3I91_04105 [Candidatus Kerfeldbacteria bacterium RIFCSPLOWO2_02_FULL_42_19]OGY85192.1 MAG: hypothetical protein A3G01_01235 [Candidatus Kerfeldbacteria bacterium RIFCSPLOWO2_12_FULL_43_9]
MKIKDKPHSWFNAQELEILAICSEIIQWTHDSYDKALFSGSGQLIDRATKLYDRFIHLNETDEIVQIAVEAGDLRRQCSKIFEKYRYDAMFRPMVFIRMYPERWSADAIIKKYQPHLKMGNKIVLKREYQFGGYGDFIEFIIEMPLSHENYCECLTVQEIYEYWDYSGKAHLDGFDKVFEKHFDRSLKIYKHLHDYGGLHRTL